MLQINEIIHDTYKVLDKIGSGSGGTVYKAYHVRLQKQVVIKEIKNAITRNGNTRLEVDILKNLRHMYLPQVYDFFEYNERMYTVIELIDGKSFNDELKRRKRFPQKKVIKWAIQLCEALEYLHTRKVPIIHSDIKPANIMLTNDDNICLIDFNVSLVFDKSSKVLGYTKGYSPPEQMSVFNFVPRMSCKGNHMTQVPNDVAKTTQISDETATKTLINHDNDISQQKKSHDTNNITFGIEKKYEKVTDFSRKFKEMELLTSGKSDFRQAVIGVRVDERSDIYSLGVTLYKLLTGDMPVFDENNDCIFDKFSLNISKGLKNILIKTMKYDKDERYQNVSELKNDLEKLK